MNITCLDCETTTSNKGNPHDQTNKLCAVGLLVLPENYTGAVKIEYDDSPYGETLRRLNQVVQETQLLIGFNLKFDLSWLNRYSIEYPGRVWDCQLFEFLDSNQTWIFPSLEESLSLRKIPGEKNKEIEQYWEAGVDTPAIPWELIEDRVVKDVQLTYQLYLKQKEVYATWPVARRNLFRLQCDDLLVLQTIERNGFYYDEAKAQVEAENTKAVLLTLTEAIQGVVGDRRINPNSDEQLSAVLYGGKILHEWKEPAGVYATGKKVGEPRYRWFQEEVVYPRLVAPLPKTAMEKEGIFSMDKKVLGRLLWKKVSKKARALIQLILKHSVESRSLSSYLEGLSKIITKMNWPRNYLHGSINQCTARTGRTSSEKPNLQSLDSDLKFLFKSRFQ